ncbi:hypothetical protein ACSX1A_10875 [Pontibacter sp. MBLB2868]|uniref:hypothetical protein n=1 Tax=Pontibacter sp. MBLB2868 TaxID=3451555 RepID=UPI003F75305D
MIQARVQFRPEIEKAVEPIALSWSVLDKAKLSKQIMVERAIEYLVKMENRVGFFKASKQLIIKFLASKYF